MANQEELDRLSVELQAQQSRGEAIRQQIQNMQATVVEIGTSIDTLRNLKKAKGDTLVPIGAGVYLSCPKPNIEKVVVNIGANVLSNKTPEDAIKMLEERQKQVAEALGSAQQDMSAVVSNIEGLTRRASMISQEEGANVRPPKE